MIAALSCGPTRSVKAVGGFRWTMLASVKRLRYACSLSGSNAERGGNVGFKSGRGRIACALCGRVGKPKYRSQEEKTKDETKRTK